MSFGDTDTTPACHHHFFFLDHNPFLARVIINGMAGEKNELTI
jgi:hypothetical protein